MEKTSKEKRCSICGRLLEEDEEDLCSDCLEEEELDFDEMLYLTYDDDT
ncbi:MAG: hypothetical protein ACTSYO_06460 [Candidatus Ranarchaeia archaeon]